MYLASVLHPLVQADVLPVAPAVVAAAGVLLVVLVARFAPAPRGSEVPLVPEVAPEALTRRAVLGRALGILTLAALGAIGYFGPLVGARNISSLILMGVGPPLLVVASAVGGTWWRHVDPFDGLARLLRAPPGASASGSVPGLAVWPAVGSALVVVWYVSALPGATNPRRLALALLAYTVVQVAGCLAFGRVAWLARAEVTGRFLCWVSLRRRWALVRWQPPSGAAVVLGVLAGGLLFRALRLTDLWTPAVFTLGGQPADLVGVLACAGAGAGLLSGFEVWARRVGNPGAAAAAAVPVVAGIAVAAFLVRGQALAASWMLPGALLDPLGLGWTLMGLRGPTLDQLPVGSAGLALIQLGVLVVGALAGAVVVRGRAVQSRRGVVPALLAVVVPFGAAVLVVTAA